MHAWINMRNMHKIISATAPDIERRY